MKLASAVEVAVAVNCEKKLKTTHRRLDSRATAIIPRRFCAPIEVHGVRCVVLYQHRVRSGVSFAHITFFPIYFVVLALTHLLILWDIIASLLSYILDPRYRISLIERNFILLRGNFSHIISTKIVSSAYNFQNLI